MHRSILASTLLALAVSASPARAELIVFEDGRVVKAASYKLHSEELEISLPGGGSYRVELGRVERIVDDEVVVDTVRVEPELFPSEGPFDLSFSAERRALFGTEYDAIIEKAAREYDIDAALVSALIRAESNYQPRAVSRKGARGLMQLMPATARRLSVRSPFDPASNVRGRSAISARARGPFRPPPRAGAGGVQRGRRRGRDLRRRPAVPGDRGLRRPDHDLVEGGGSELSALRDQPSGRTRRSLIAGRDFKGSPAHRAFGFGRSSDSALPAEAAAVASRSDSL